MTFFKDKKKIKLSKLSNAFSLKQKKMMAGPSVDDFQWSTCTLKFVLFLCLILLIPENKRFYCLRLQKLHSKPCIDGLDFNSKKDVNCHFQLKRNFEG